MERTLIERLEAGEAGREIDEAVALKFRIVTMWKSKHGYWNVEPKIAGMNPTTVHGRPREYEYDPVTGEKLPPEELPGGWGWDVNLPCYTTSLDAAVALVERVRPKAWIEINGPRKYLNIPTPVPNYWKAVVAPWEDKTEGIGWAATPAAALVAALLRTAPTPPDTP